MQQTEHYALNQWDPEDRILRTDFNGDNAKIDAAIAAVKAELSNQLAAVPFVKLLDITTETAALKVDLDVSQLHPEQFWELFLYFIPAASSTETGLYLTLNSQTKYYHSSDISTYLTRCIFDNAATGFRFCRFQLLMGEQISGGCLYSYKSSTQYWVNEENMMSSEVTPADLHTITLSGYSSPTSIGTGSRFVLFGLRK